MKKVIFFCFVALCVFNGNAQSKKSAPKVDTVIQYVLVMSPSQMESLKNFISNPTYFTSEGGNAYWNSAIVPNIRPFKEPVQLPALPDSANKK